MNWKTIGLVVLFVDFTAFTAYAMATEGVVGFLALITQSAWSLQVLLDLVIALTFVLVWMIRDARQRGGNALPYAVATLFLGSIAPLAYLVRREVGDALARRRVAHA